MKSTHTYDCQMALDHLIAELELNQDTTTILAELIEIYPDCERRLKETAETWKDLRHINTPAPSQEMHDQFYRRLKSFESEPAITEPSIPQRPRIRLILLRYAAAIVMLITGIFIGRYWGSEQNVDTLVNTKAPGTESSELIFANTSAIDRLEQVQRTKDIKNPDKIIFESLNQVLLNDANINVRLSAIEAMLHFSQYPEVREYLVQAISRQESPIVQIALADAMRALQEKNSLDPLKQLIESGALDLEVKNYYEKTIKEIM